MYGPKNVWVVKKHATEEETNNVPTTNSMVDQVVETMVGGFLRLKFYEIASTNHVSPWMQKITNYFRLLSKLSNTICNAKTMFPRPIIDDRKEVTPFISGLLSYI